jgi:acetyl-CoA decarbonylase/synthase, CODH/ACS complex subunit delta
MQPAAREPVELPGRIKGVCNMPVEFPKEKYPGSVRKITLGATSASGGTRSNTVTVGGEKALPFMHFEGEMPCPPVIALEIKDQRPSDWSPVLLDAWGAAANDPASWAKAGEALGVKLIVLNLSATDSGGSPMTTARAVETVKAVLAATGLPLIVFGPGQADLDNLLLVAVAEAAKGERLALGICEDTNYRTIVATAMANGHIVCARSPIDVNLAKQLNILISDMGMSPDSILMDPSTAALGYGIEYGYSVMERLRLAALQGDVMTQSPIIITAGFEAWKTKEAKFGSAEAGIPAAWGEWSQRAIGWETLAAVAMLEAGADILVLRHPESVRTVQKTINELVTAPNLAAA